MTALKSKRIAFLCNPEGTEQVELTEPWAAVREAGGTPVLVSTERGDIQAFNHLERADSFPVDALAHRKGLRVNNVVICLFGLVGPWSRPGPS